MWMEPQHVQTTSRNCADGEMAAGGVEIGCHPGFERGSAEQPVSSCHVDVRGQPVRQTLETHLKLNPPRICISALSQLDLATNHGSKRRLADGMPGMKPCLWLRDCRLHFVTSYEPHIIFVEQLQSTWSLYLSLHPSSS